MALGFLGQLGSGYLSTGVQTPCVRDWNVPVWSRGQTIAFQLQSKGHGHASALMGTMITCHRLVGGMVLSFWLPLLQPCYLR